jgi:hypothetical protein
MRYLGASVAVLAAAMTISLIPLGRTAWASDDMPVVRSGMDINAILPLSASSSSTITRDIDRYGGTKNKPTLLEKLAHFQHGTCTEVSEGAWTYTDTQTCGTEKCGKVTTGTVTSTLGSCPGKTFTFVAIYYEWTAHNNQSNLSAPLNKVADTFNATWTSPHSTMQFTFDITVPVVRPDHETTAFEKWSPEFPTVGEWKQTLVPPSSDPTFDFSGESVQEQVGGAGEDTCHVDTSPFPPRLTITGGPPDGWPVKSGNVWEPDQVGWKPDAVTYYRNHRSTTLEFSGSCSFTIQQQMTIKAPSDDTTSNNMYGAVNALRGTIEYAQVISERAGMSMTETWQPSP